MTLRSNEAVRSSSEWPTAIHEAGHAVTARAVGLAPHGITVENEKDTQGRSSCSVFLLASGKRDTRQKIEQQIMFSLAGSLAEEIVDSDGESAAWGARQDHQLAVVLASYVIRDPLETHAYIDWLAIRTRNLLCNPTWWGVVLGLADRLITERTMSPSRCERAIEEPLEASDQTRLAEITGYEGDGDRRAGIVAGRRLTDHWLS